MKANILVSINRMQPADLAAKEIEDVFRKIGEEAIIMKTIASGILAVNTNAKSREVIARMRDIFFEDPFQFKYTLKWAPADNWCKAEIPELKKTLEKIKGEIKKGETWAMQVEKRRTDVHATEIIKEIAPVITEKVDLEKPDKIVRIEVIGKEASVTILTSKDIFSVVKGE